MHRIHPTPGGHASQEGSAASPLSVSALYKQSIGGMIDGWIQSTENRLSQYFWQGISSLPKSYFSKDITAVDYQDKSFWEGVFNNEIVCLKEQCGTEWLAPSPAQNDKGGAKLDKLKEQTAAGFFQGDLSLEAHLVQLQGLVGKNTLSPQCYEKGLACLKQILGQSYAPVIEKTRRTFRAELKKQPEFLAECFQGDVFDLFKCSQLFSRTDLQQIVDYYRPLMNQKHFAKHKKWLKSCYHEQSLLPPPAVNKSVYQPPLEKPLTTKKNGSRYWYSIGSISKFLWEHAGKLVTLGLTAQMVAVRAAGSGKDYNLKCSENTSMSSCIESKILGLVDLFDQMKNDDKLYNDQILPLASEIKNIMLLGDYPSVSEPYRCEFTTLKNNIPLPAVNLIWKGDSCSIKDINRNEYLYAGIGKISYDGYRRNVFTWIKKGDSFNPHYWVLKRDTAGSFKIKNNVYDEYLYAAYRNLLYDNYRRRVFTWRKKGDSFNPHYWNIKMNASGIFEIRSNDYDEYLYSAPDRFSYNSNRRRVFTWGGKGACKDYFIWEISC